MILLTVLRCEHKDKGIHYSLEFVGIDITCLTADHFSFVFWCREDCKLIFYTKIMGSNAAFIYRAFETQMNSAVMMYLF